MLVRVEHHIPARLARTRLIASPEHLQTLALHLKQSDHVKSVRTTGRSILVQHDDSLSDLVCHIEAEGIAEVLHLPEGSATMLEKLGPGVLSAAAVAVWFLLL